VDRIKNPFSPGAGSPPPELAGREGILEQARVLLGRVLGKRPEKSILLTGMRGVGKTVLLNEIERMAQRVGYRTILIEAHEEKRLAALLVPHLRRLLYDLDRIAGAGDKVRRGIGVLKSFIGAVFVATALGGAAILLWMAFAMFRSLPSLRLSWGAEHRRRNHPVVSGVLMSVANPYWIIWWATIGLGYILYSWRFGLWGVAFFFAGHILADLAWYTVVAAAVAGASPSSRAITSASSRMPCPTINSGPAMNPRCELSLIVAVSSGPGIIAPDRAMTKDEAKMVRNVDIISYCLWLH